MFVAFMIICELQIFVFDWMFAIHAKTTDGLSLGNLFTRQLSFSRT